MKGNKKAAAQNKENKNKERQEELLAKYKVVRALPFSMEVQVRLNKEVEVERVPTPEEAPPVIEDKKGGKKK
jgi:ribosomal protein S25